MGRENSREPSRRLLAMCSTEHPGLLGGERTAPRRDVVRIYFESRAAGFPEGVGVEGEWKRRHR